MKKMQTPRLNKSSKYKYNPSSWYNKVGSMPQPKRLAALNNYYFKKRFRIRNQWKEFSIPSRLQDLLRCFRSNKIKREMAFSVTFIGNVLSVSEL